jgi:hypothetical protein
MPPSMKMSTRWMIGSVTHCASSVYSRSGSDGSLAVVGTGTRASSMMLSIAAMARSRRLVVNLQWVTLLVDKGVVTAGKENGVVEHRRAPWPFVLKRNVWRMAKLSF